MMMMMMIHFNEGWKVFVQCIFQIIKLFKCFTIRDNSCGISFYWNVRLKFVREHKEAVNPIWERALWRDETKILLFWHDSRNHIWGKDSASFKPKHRKFVCVQIFFSLQCKYKVKLATAVEGDPSAPFSIANAERCREGRYSFTWIAPLYPWSYLIKLSVKQGGIKYHFLSPLYD